jgi:hypothetical protein
MHIIINFNTQKLEVFAVPQINALNGNSIYASSKTSLKLRHNLCSQPYGRKVPCVFNEISSMAILVSYIITTSFHIRDNLLL